jgi:CheY-like chemotaxis protein
MTRAGPNHANFRDISGLSSRSLWQLATDCDRREHREGVELAFANVTLKPPPSPGSGPRRNVLIVEDDDDVRDILGEIVGEMGHRALDASNGNEALERMEETRLDVALIDLSLPGVDGYELARRIRQTVEGAGIRLVALTGYSDAKTRRNAEAAGFDDFLVKPATPSMIEQLVNGPPPRRPARR